MTYFEFKADYISILQRIQQSEDGTMLRMFLNNQLSDLEELHPAWAERVEDLICQKYPELA